MLLSKEIKEEVIEQRRHNKFDAFFTTRQEYTREPHIVHLAEKGLYELIEALKDKDEMYYISSSIRIVCRKTHRAADLLPGNLNENLAEVAESVGRVLAQSYEAEG